MPDDPPNFIHRFLPGESAAPLLLLHGTGGDENNLLDLGRSVWPTASLLSPRGKILENGTTPRFFRRLAEGVFDEPDLIRRTHELADFILWAAGEYHFDAARVVALGYSNGATIASALLLLRPGTLRGAVLLRGMVPLVPEPPPDLTGLPVFLAAGRHDTIIPPASTERLAVMLRALGADVSLHWSESGHQLILPELEAAHDWLETTFPR